MKQSNMFIKDWIKGTVFGEKPSWSKCWWNIEWTVNNFTIVILFTIFWKAVLSLINGVVIIFHGTVEGLTCILLKIIKQTTYHKQLKLNTNGIKIPTLRISKDEIYHTSYSGSSKYGRIRSFQTRCLTGSIASRHSYSPIVPFATTSWKKKSMDYRPIMV